MVKLKTEKAKGILNQKAGEQWFTLARYLPAPPFETFVEHYWIVRWDLHGQPPYLQENLPYPSVHLVFEPGNSRVIGVVKGKFSVLLKDKGQVFGIKFRPGGFYPFVRRSVADFTDRSVALTDVFDPAIEALIEPMLTLADDAAMVALAEDYLRDRLPEADLTARSVDALVECVRLDRSITKVGDLVTRTGVSARTLQRLFRQYVGVSPKWVIQRFRLHEATEHLDEDAAVAGARLAAELGYFDQAHFIKDFKSLVGRSPADYAKQREPRSSDEPGLTPPSAAPHFRKMV